MSAEIKEPEQLAQVVHIDSARIKRLKKRANLIGLIEEFEMLRMKFFYDKLEDRREATRLVTLCKYFLENGPTESFRLSCKLFYDKYMKNQGL